MPDEVVEREFEMVTTAQTERTYVVKAADVGQAQKRLRTFFADAELLRDGLVTPVPEKMTNTTPERIKSSTPVKPQAKTSARTRRAPQSEKPTEKQPGGGSDEVVQETPPLAEVVS